MEIIRLADGNVEAAAREAALVLRAGGIVLFPTDTLYGLAVDALNQTALERLRELKGRERRKPISIILDSVDAIHEHALWTREAQLLAARHLPGALTLVLLGKPHLPEELMLNGEIGIRVPDDAFALALARVFGLPFTATSANRSGLPAQDTTADILADFGSFVSYIDLVIDAGVRNGGAPSTVVSFKNGEAQVLREGVISRGQILGSE